MNAYDVFIEPTTVNNCVGCNFISSQQKHLVVAKTSILQIFEVLKKKPTATHREGYKLKLVSQYKVQGKITDIKPIRTIESNNLDYLLISTEKAKFSCIKWDSTKHGIQTVSLHFYEHVLEETSYEDIPKSQLLVDPNSKALACLRQANMLVFLPFHQLGDEDEDDSESDDDESGIDKSNQDKQNSNDARDADASKVEFSAAVPRNMSLFEESLVLEINSLNNSIGEVIDIRFLNNYRRPTIAVLSQQKRTWTGLLPTSKDNVQFTVLSLNLRARSATTVLKLENLPYDIERIYPVPGPMNGSLLVGSNELIHVDGGGISRRIALNEYFADTTDMARGFSDQSSLNLKLENCTFAKISNETKLLMLLRDGTSYCISFEMDGKAIKKMFVEGFVSESFNQWKVHMPGEVASLDDDLLFFSSRTDDASLVTIKGKQHAASAPSATLTESKAEEEEDDFYDEMGSSSGNISQGGIIEVIEHDSLTNNGPVSSFTLGHYSREKFVTNLPNPDYESKSIFASGGLADTGHINIFTPTIQPEIKTSLTFSQLNRLWTLSNKYLITSDDPNNKSEIFDITQSYARLPAKQFIHDELTVAMHELSDGKYILQVTPKHVVLYNNRFKRMSTLDSELSDVSDADIITSVYDDGFLMLFLSTGELMIYTINTYSKTFTKIPLPKLLNEALITTGYITNSRLLNAVTKDLTLLTARGQKRSRGGNQVAAVKADESFQDPKSKIFIVVTGDNRIVVFNRFHNEKCFQLNSAEKFSDLLTLGFFDIVSGEPDPVIKQVVLNDLGDETCKEEYLTILTVGGEIYCYKLFFDGENFKFIKDIDTPITGAPFNAFAEGTSIERRMVFFSNISGFTCILVTGIIPFLIVKERKSTVRVFKFSKIPIVSFVPFSDDNLKNALIYLDTKKNARIVEIPQSFNYENRLPMRRVNIGETVKSLAYHEGSNTFLVSTFKEIPYDCVDLEGNPIFGLKPNKPREASYKGSIKLLSPMNWGVIDTMELEDNEVGLHLKTVPLDVGSSLKRFKNRKEFVLVGTGRYATEDLVANGAYKLIEIIDIIPEPGKPETNHKLKVFTHEDVRGAVTAICDVTGRFLIAQGQKIIVRDIKDNSAVPVAFLDTAVYVTEAKSFGNFVLLGDTLKSVWLAGFDAEPFRMLMLSKDVHGHDVSCADFLVKDENLHIVLADSKGVLHALQYNPEDPTSSNGQRLLSKAAFNTNFKTSCMKNVPKFEQFNQSIEPDRQTFQTIASSTEGAFYVIFPVDESLYRKFYVLQQQLIEKEFHPCGLNPKSNRMGSTTATDGSSRPILDCELIRRYAKLNDDRKTTLMQKIGINAQVELWKDLVEMENVLNVL
ncbi:hypothetical protein FT663_05469 [Candidozyma haemuli var. vulneris]|nr:hypothetical protein FT663_05469 [[Candida] haemuloni var. vulneris]KAF3987153.1 hypothetical protein FT662_04171 [[Candida] haemuloni var. vulneris]